MNRTRCFLLLIVLSVNSLARAQYDNGDFTVDNFTYVITSPNTVKLIKAENQKGDVTIPSEVTYKVYHFMVTALESYCFDRQDIESVVVPSTVKDIERAFSGCSKLRKVMLPEELTIIRENAFLGCSALSDITLPSSVCEIMESAFRDCTSLTHLTLHEGIVSIGDDAFRNSGLKEIKLPKSLQTIGKEAFMESQLEEVEIDGQIDNMPDLVFSNCVNLKKVVMHDGTVKSLGTAVFGDCVSLQSIKVSEGVSVFDSFTFSGCTALTHVFLPSSLRQLGMGTFQNCKSLQEIDVPFGVSSIDNTTFKACYNLKNITIPASVTSIGTNAFQDCTHLESVTLCGEFVQIKDNAFIGCKALTKLECLMDSVTTPGGIYESGCFEENVFSQAKLLVRNRLLEQYKVDKTWGQFLSIEALPDTPIVRSIQLDIQGEGSVWFKGREYRGGTAMLQFNKGEDAVIRVVPDEYHETFVKQRKQYEADQTLFDGLEGEVDISAVPVLYTVNVNFRTGHGNITIKQVEEGCVHMKAELIHDYELSVNTVDGWRVHSVSMDGEDVTDAFRNGSFNLRLMHDVTFVIALEEETSGISQLADENQLRIIVDGNRLYLHHLEKGEMIHIYTVNGHLVKQLKANDIDMEVQLPPNKVYLIRTKSKTIKVLCEIR